GEAFRPLVDSFVNKYAEKLTNPPVDAAAIKEYMSLAERLVPIRTYASLRLSADQGDANAQQIASTAANLSTYFGSETSFLSSELLEKDDPHLEEIKSISPDLEGFVDKLLKEKPYRLDAKVEKVL